MKEEERRKNESPKREKRGEILNKRKKTISKDT
jgi:hypothetical protein